MLGSARQRSVRLGNPTLGYLYTALTGIMMVCVVVILVASVGTWRKMLEGRGGLAVEGA